MEAKRIDPHVHCRDGNQNYVETIEHVLDLAEQQGVDYIADMPNTSPPIIRIADVCSRLALVPHIMKSRYFLHMGLTANESQIIEAVDAVRRFKNVIGLKMYAGKSGISGNNLLTYRSKKLSYPQITRFKKKLIIS